ncbi:PH domain-containing protein [Qipengyuania psychrotolerans]|uniref:PH domain-containing protein n=1 Tax=Qipengyuania psychrotolerans TaxID=2867238 RepID=A0ABX8ZDQ8_9SPHN|nr:PH domain-containing protein [Qipengyuania psychrotolerans]QZD87122.1 PH domain-containing protein [Qipengyuania psychrotolerans]
MSESSREARRTDPRTVVVQAASYIISFVPAAIAIFIFTRDEADKMAFIVPVLALLIAVNIGGKYLQWTRFTYATGDADIRVEKGLLSRAARSVPYERVQDVSLEQKLVPRLFGLVEVRFETGAGGKEDLTLAYLTEAEGERLRELVRERREGTVPAGEVAATQVQETDDAPPLFAMDEKRVFTFGIFEFSLAVVAVIGGLAQQFEFLLPFELWDIDGWQERLTGPGQQLAGLGPLAQAIGIIFALATLAVLGFATGIVRTALREWGFRLDRTDKGLRRRRGLLTRTDLVMPVHRVQALRLETGFLRRLFGWYGLKVISLASDSGAANHEAAPFAQMDEIAPIVAETGFELPPENTQWHRAMDRYRLDKMLLASALLLPATVLTIFIADSIQWLIPAGLLGAAILHHWWRWRHDRHAIDAKQVYSRHGWFSPSLAIGSRVKLQSAEILQGPIARRRGYASLLFGLAGGNLRIHGMPLETARLWRVQILDSISGTDFSDLLEPGAEAQAA